MKKTFILILAFLALFSFSSCGGGESSGDVDLAELKNQMVADLSIENANDIPTESLMNLYGITADEVAAQASFTTMSGSFPDEVVMIKAKDENAGNSVAEKLETRVEEVKVQSENYDAENYALAQKCRVLQSGVYVAMFLSPNYDKMAEIWNGAVNG